LNSEGGGEGGFRAGVELIHREFLKALERVGVRPFIAVGEVFDPQRHEAVARVDRPDVPDPTVVNEVQRGYLIGDRVLRPGRVVGAVESRRSEFPGADSRAPADAPNRGPSRSAPTWRVDRPWPPATTTSCWASPVTPATPRSRRRSAGSPWSTTPTATP